MERGPAMRPNVRCEVAAPSTHPRTVASSAARKTTSSTASARSAATMDSRLSAVKRGSVSPSATGTDYPHFANVSHRAVDSILKGSLSIDLIQFNFNIF